MPGVFPTLRTGATAQYPLLREVRFSTEIVRFLDGSEQAYRNGAAPRSRWVLDLSALDDREVAMLKAFFEQQKGRWGTFTFADPWTGQVYPACSFENDTFPQAQNGEDRNSARLVIYEHA